MANDTAKVAVGTKDVEVNVRRVTALLSVDLTADDPAHLLLVGRGIITKALGNKIDIDGLDPASRDVPVKMLGPGGELMGTRTVRQISGFTPGKPSTVFFSVQVRPGNQERLEDFQGKLYAAIDKASGVSVVSVREGS